MEEIYGDMRDLTIVYYTANIIPEDFAYAVMQILIKAANGLPIISVSQKPVDLEYNNKSFNICVGDIGRSNLNIYRQALIGAKMAKTKYIAMAEDDILYSPDHFFCHIPKSGDFSYNINIWGIYTWVKPAVFSYKGRRGLHSLICERSLFIEAMEERFKKYPDDSKTPLKYWSEPGKYESKGHLNVTIRNTEEFGSKIPNIVFSHNAAMGFKTLGTRKRLGRDPRKELDYWGAAETILGLYK